MSKAFTSDQAPDLPALTRGPPILAPGEVRYVTPEGHAALHSELERLRAAIAAGEPGEERGALERKATLVAGTIAALTVLAPDAGPPDVVAFGRWVTVELDGGGVRTWRIVGPDEADPRRGLVSVHAPVGRAHLAFARPKGAGAHLGELVRAAAAVLGGKGGGAPDLAQGSGPEWTMLERALEQAARALA